MFARKAPVLPQSEVL